MVSGGKKPRRRIPKGSKPMPDTWLYDHPGGWKMLPEKFPIDCGWCGQELTVIERWWRVCPKCDVAEEKDDDE